MRKRGLFGLAALGDQFGVGRVPFRAGHREFRERALASRECVVWTFPDVDPDIIWRQPHSAEQASAIAKSIEKEPDHPAVRECWRIFQGYRSNLIEALIAHERRYNLGQMAQVAIVRPHPPRFAIQHVAQCGFANAYYPILVDSTEEDPLINAPVGKDSPS